MVILDLRLWLFEIIYEYINMNKEINPWGGGAAWGLTTNVGPWDSTPKDLREYNSRAGGPHAGHGNWMQTYTPHPYIQTKPNSNQYNYVDGPAINVHEDFKATQRIPGLKKPGGPVVGNRKTTEPTTKYGVRGSEPFNGPEGNGFNNQLHPTDRGPTSSHPRLTTAANILDESVVYSPESNYSLTTLGSSSSTTNESERRYSPPPFTPSGPPPSYSMRGPNSLNHQSGYDSLPPYSPASPRTAERLRTEAAERASY